jgi:arginine decarboxylase
VVSIDPRDPLSLRTDAPLVDGLLRYLDSDVVPLHTPGHKRQTHRFGPVLEGDVTLYGGVDTIRGRHGRLEAAEAKATRLWGGDWARFSVAGSTHGNQALALAVGEPGDTVIVSRILHRSLLLGMVLAGLRPVWVGPDVDHRTGLPMGVPVEAVREALAANPQAKAVFLVEPSYVGTAARLEDHAEVVHAHGIPLVVDQAWGGHFGFHPEVPPHALQLGADAFVTSVHKALTGYTQAALLVARTERLDPDRLTRAFDATHTTSPAGQIMASIDATRALLERDGEALLSEALRISSSARDRLRGISGVDVLDEADVPARSRFDPTKLTLSVAGAGVDGGVLDDALADLGYPVEYSDRNTLVATVSIFDDADEIDGFVDTVIETVEKLRGEPRPASPHVAWTVRPRAVLRPRDAFFAPHETVAADDAVGRVSAEIVAPYPPGVPVLAPGEEITAEALQALRDVKADGALVRYAADPSLATFQVVVDGGSPGASP